MKSLILMATLIFTSNLFAMDGATIAKLHQQGKTQQKPLIEAHLSKASQKALLNKLKKLAESKADIWPDTILEGPYALLGEAQLESENVTGIYFNDQLIGFSATVSADAADTVVCTNRDELLLPEAEAELFECFKDYKGVISEEFIVDLKGNLIERFRSHAEFDN